MAHQFPSAVNFNQQEAQNQRIHNLGTAPATPAVGQIWLNTGDGFIYYRDNAGNNRQLVHFTALLATRLDQFAAPTANLSLNTQRIINLGDPIGAQDGVTKAYVDALVQGMKWKDTVRVVASANIVLSGTQTIDGVIVVAGDRVAVQAQTTGGQNGIYIASAGAWTRSNDADTAAEVLGMTYFVSEGTATGNRTFNMTTDAPITLGTTVLLFAQISAGVTISAGTGLLLSGSVLSIDMAVTARKIEGLIGNGAATSFTVSHNLTSTALVAGLWKVSTGEMWMPDVSLTGGSSTSQVTFNFGFVPTTNEFRWAIHG